MSILRPLKNQIHPQRILLYTEHLGHYWGGEQPPTGNTKKNFRAGLQKPREKWAAPYCKLISCKFVLITLFGSIDACYWIRYHWQSALKQNKNMIYSL